MIDPSRITAFDFETKGNQPLYGLQPARAVTGDAWPTTCAVAYVHENQFCAEGLVKPSPQDISDWLDRVIAAGHFVVCWNAPFDVGWILALAKANPHLNMRDKVFKIRWLDGLLIYRHTINTPSFRPEGRVSLGLKPAVDKFLPQHSGYADDVDFDDESPENVAKLLTYNKRDSLFTLEIVTMLLAKMDRDQLRAMMIEAYSIPDVAEAVIEGIVLNPQACEDLGVKLEKARAVAFVSLKLDNPEVTEEVLASPKQLQELLFTKWGLPIVGRTDTGAPSTDKEALTELAVHDPRAKLIHEYRDAAYCKAKFSVSPLASLAYNGDGRTRPQPRIFGTYTGRMTYSSKVGRGAAEQPTGVALHQWKRDPEYRAIIEPPEGCDLLEFDFAGQEFRWMAVESDDQQMIALCADGEDPHSFMGAQVSGDDYRWLQTAAGDGNHPDHKKAKPIRQLGKVGNLSLQYRTSPPTLVKVAAVQHKMALTLPDSQRIHKTYLRTYKRVPIYWKRQIRDAKAHGFVRTLAGRRLDLGDHTNWVWTDANGVTQDWKWGYESAAINFPIQGIGADQKYLAILCARDLCTKYGARFYFELHDGIFFVCPSDKAEAFGHEMKALLSNLPYDAAWGVKLPVKFPVDGKRGPSWGKLKEFH